MPYIQWRADRWLRLRRKCIITLIRKVKPPPDVNGRPFPTNLGGHISGERQRTLELGAKTG